MKGRKTRCVLFFFWLVLATLSGTWIFLSIIDGMKLFLIEPSYKFVFFISCLSFVLSILSIREAFTNAKNTIKDLKNKEKNVKEMYRYNQLLDPPDADMNN